MQGYKRKVYSLTLPADATGQLHVFWHDCDTSSMDGAQIRVLEQADEVGFRSFLESEHGRALESQVILELGSDLPNEALEGKLSDQELSALLEATDLSQRHGARSVPVSLLDTANGRGLLGRRLMSDVLAGCFSASVLAGCMLRTCHSFL